MTRADMTGFELRALMRAHEMCPEKVSWYRRCHEHGGPPATPAVYKALQDNWFEFMATGFARGSDKFHLWRGSLQLLRPKVYEAGPYEGYFRQWMFETTHYCAGCFGEALLTVLSHDPALWWDGLNWVEDVVFEEGA